MTITADVIGGWWEICDHGRVVAVTRDWNVAQKAVALGRRMSNEVIRTANR